MECKKSKRGRVGEAGLAGAISFMLVGCAVHPSADATHETPQQREQRKNQENMMHTNLGASVKFAVPHLPPRESVLKAT